MNRNKKMVVLSHCLMNSNAKVEGLATYSGISERLIKLLLHKDYGMIQLPCPELVVYGIKRWGHVKDQFDNPHYRNQCKNILKNYVLQFENYIDNGYEIRCIIGVENSPSCGLNKTCKSNSWGGTLDTKERQQNLDDIQMVSESGVFIEELKKLLAKVNIDIPIIAFDEENIEKSFKKIKKYI